MQMHYRDTKIAFTYESQNIRGGDNLVQLSSFTDKNVRPGNIKSTQKVPGHEIECKKFS